MPGNTRQVISGVEALSFIYKPHGYFPSLNNSTVDNESLCSDDVEVWHESTVKKREVEEVVEKREIKIITYDSLLDEMKKNQLHCNSETRNVQEKIDEMSAEKSQQKEELNEMQHKAQVCIGISLSRLESSLM